MKFGVVVFPGSNCDYEMIHVLSNVIKQEVVELSVQLSRTSFHSATPLLQKERGTRALAR